jgi:hypothetical protein
MLAIERDKTRKCETLRSSILNPKSLIALVEQKSSRTFGPSSRCRGGAKEAIQ